MKRLTKRWEAQPYPNLAGKVICEYKECDSTKSCENCIHGRYKDRLADIEDILGDEYNLERLQELVEAEKEDRYIIMKEPRQAGVHRLTELAKAANLLGKTVYEPNKRGFVSTYEIISVHISTCSVLVGWNLLDGIYSNLNGFEISALGKTVFLTRAEAEDALKAREQNE